MIAHRISMSENVLFRGGLYSYGPPEVFSVLQSDKYYKEIDRKSERESERAREKREKNSKKKGTIHFRHSGGND